MKSKLALCAALVALLSIDMYAPPVDACGVKLAIKNSRPRKAAARSSRPSHLLLVGSPPARLQHDLAASGHDVEVVTAATDAKRPSYAVVVVASNEQATEAHSRFPDAMVVVRSGDVTADINSVENQVARRLVRAGDGRTVIAAGPTRTPIGAAEKDQVVAARAGGPTPIGAKDGSPEAVPTTQPVKATTTVAKETPAKQPTETPTKTVAKETPTEEPKQVATIEPKTVPAPTKPAKVEQPKKIAKTSKAMPATADGAHEVYFMFGSAAIDATRVDPLAQWLTENSDAHAIIEGHADPTGNHAANMTLSKARAEAVRDALVAAGIDTSRLEVKAFGDTKIKYGKADPRNRRVAVVRGK